MNQNFNQFAIIERGKAFCFHLFSSVVVH